jgi:DNA repair exonuclease SbcCD ATPase subunit
MGLSSKQIKVSYDGEYGLDELMEILGSPKKLKDEFAKLNKLSKDTTAALKDLDARKAELEARLLSFKEYVDNENDKLDDREAYAKHKLDEKNDFAKRTQAEFESREKAVSEREAQLAEAWKILEKTEKDKGRELHNAQIELNRKYDELDAAAKRSLEKFEKSVAMEKKAIAMMKDAEKKVADLKKVLG